MPDKEFDNLFRDKFKDAEIEPSANLWVNIEQQLAPKKKRVFPIYWLAVASVAIAITVMLVFNKKEVIKLQGTQETATLVKPVVVEDSIGVVKSDNAPKNTVLASYTTTKATSKLITKGVNMVDNKQFENNSQNNQVAMQPNNESNRLSIKQQEVKPLAIVPIKETVVENPIVIAKVDAPQNIEDNTINESGVERRGIRNVGDLVNFVVDKVDKRDKKLLRFNTDDDDNSSLIGINIGFLKLNSKKHK